MVIWFSNLRRRRRGLRAGARCLEFQKRTERSGGEEGGLYALCWLLR